MRAACQPHIHHNTSPCSTQHITVFITAHHRAQNNTSLRSSHHCAHHNTLLRSPYNLVAPVTTPYCVTTTLGRALLDTFSTSKLLRASSAGHAPQRADGLGSFYIQFPVSWKSMERWQDMLIHAPPRQSLATRVQSAGVRECMCVRPIAPTVSFVLASTVRAGNSTPRILHQPLPVQDLAPSSI